VPLSVASPQPMQGKRGLTGAQSQAGYRRFSYRRGKVWSGTYAARKRGKTHGSPPTIESITDLGWGTRGEKEEERPTVRFGPADLGG